MHLLYVLPKITQRWSTFDLHVFGLFCCKNTFSTMVKFLFFHISIGVVIETLSEPLPLLQFDIYILCILCSFTIGRVDLQLLTLCTSSISVVDQDLLPLLIIESNLLCIFLFHRFQSLQWEWKVFWCIALIDSDGGIEPSWVSLLRVDTNMICAQLADHQLLLVAVHKACQDFEFHLVIVEISWLCVLLRRHPLLSLVGWFTFLVLLTFPFGHSLFLLVQQLLLL